MSEACTCITWDAGDAVQMNSIIVTVNIAVTTSYWRRPDDAHYTTTWQQTVNTTQTFEFTRVPFDAKNMIVYINGSPSEIESTPMDAGTYALLRRCDRAWPTCISPDNRKINWNTTTGEATIDGNALIFNATAIVDDDSSITYSDPDEIPDTDPVEYYEMPDDQFFDGPYVMGVSVGLFCDPMLNNASNPKHAWFTLDLSWQQGAGATATASCSGGEVTSISGGGGLGYLSGATVTIEGDGSGASAFANVDEDGVITSIDVTFGGSGYTFATVRIGGFGATLVQFAAEYPTTPPKEINIMTMTLQGGGNDFGGVMGGSTRSPGVQSMDISAVVTPCGGGATAHATVIAGVISDPVVDSPGSGYTYGAFGILDGSGLGAPIGCISDGDEITSVFLDDDGGSGWGDPDDDDPHDIGITIYPVGEGADTASADCFVIGGGLNRCEISDGGSNYWTGAVGVVKGDGGGATVRIVCEGGQVVKIIVVTPGHDYTQAKTRIRIFGNPCGPIQSLELIGHPGVFTVTPSVIFYGANFGASGAAGSASLDVDGLVDSVTLTSGGHGYTGVGTLLYSPVVPNQTVDSWIYDVSIQAEVT